METARTVLALGLLSQALFYAFSRPSRREILDRDSHECQGCGATKHLEAAHDNHDRESPEYNEPHNGTCLCVRCHYMHHLNNRDFPEDIGLSVDYNDMAINSLYKRMPKLWSMSIPSPEATDNELRKWNLWIYGDEDYWANRDGIMVEDWPINVDIKHDSEVK